MIRKWLRYLSILTLLATSSVAAGQKSDEYSRIVARIADEIYGPQDLDINYEELYENLLQIFSTPYNLNQISEEEMRSLHILTETQINAFVKYRNEGGPLFSLYELQTIPELDLNTIKSLVPLVMVDDPSQSVDGSFIRRVLEETNNYLIIRYERTLEQKAGFTSTDSTTQYTGSPDKLYMRFRTAHRNDFSMGFTMEKDAGEPLSWSRTQLGTDFTSFHMQVLNKKRIKNLIIGDYQAQFGQGLSLGGGFGMGKGAESITTIRRGNLGFLPYTSVNESGYFRGIALSALLMPHITLHGFLSHIRQDGNITQNNEFTPMLTSLYQSGFHRSVRELNNRKNVPETNYGAILSYRKNQWDLGTLFHQTQFKLPIGKAERVYNQFTFSGKQNRNVGLYANYSFRNTTLFSETSHSIGHGTSLLLGLLSNLSPQLDLSILYRSYGKNYYTFYSSAFGENTLPQNEAGIYWGWKYTLNPTWSASGYVDIFRFPWLKFRTYSPSEGNEWLLRINYKPTRDVTMFVQMRQETKPRNLSQDNGLYTTNIGVKSNYWINFDYAAGLFTFKTRAQFSTYTLDESISKGFALVQDANLDWRKWSLSLRYGLFETEDYENRQYIYERDVWLAYSLPAYAGKGLRTYAMLHYSANSSLTFWFRWAKTRYLDQESIGSGGEKINSGNKNDVKVQVRLKLK